MLFPTGRHRAVPRNGAGISCDHIERQIGNLLDHPCSGVAHQHEVRPMQLPSRALGLRCAGPCAPHTAPRAITCDHYRFPVGGRYRCGQPVA